MEAIIQDLAHPSGPRTAQAFGTWGIGKTWLLTEAGRRAEAEGALVLFADAGQYVPDANPGTECGVSQRELEANFYSFLRLVSALYQHSRDVVTITTKTGLVSDEWQNPFADVEDAVRTAFEDVGRMAAWDRSPHIAMTLTAGGNFTAAQGSRIAEASINADRSEELCALIAHQVARVTAVIGSTLRLVGRNRRILFLLDNYDRLAGHPIQGWVAGLMSEAEHHLAVTAVIEPQETSPDHALPWLIRLRPFAEAEVSTYLSSVLGGGPVGDELVANVLDMSGGLPVAVGLIGDLLAQRNGSGELGDLAALSLDDIQDKEVHLLATVVAEVGDTYVRSALREARLARRFDREIIQAILFKTEPLGHAEDSARAQLVLDQLRRYSFVENVRGPGIPQGSYRFHRFISQTARADCPPKDLYVDCEAIHQKLAEAWMRQMERLETEYDADNGLYGPYYVYESPEWQAASLEWLHHLGQLRSHESRIRGRLDFSRILLKTFWWFGCYAEFDYCEQLLDDLDRTQPIEDRELISYFRTMMRGYPLGWRKQDQGDWPGVRHALLALQSELRIGGKVARPGAVESAISPVIHASELINLRREVRAYTCVFLAHTYRYQTGSAETAIGFYRDAMELYRLLGDEVSLAWGAFEEADLLVELDRLDQALGKADQALRHLLAAQDEVDHELLANLHRVRASVLVESPALTADAVREVAYAVCRGYVYLFRPHEPDAYTLTFYQEMLERAGELIGRIRDLYGMEAAFTATEELRSRLTNMHLAAVPGTNDRIRSALSGQDTAALADILAPPVPDPLRPETLASGIEAVALIEGHLDVESEFTTVRADSVARCRALMPDQVNAGARGSAAP